MRKLVLPLLMFGMIAIFVPAAEARTGEVNALSSETLSQQWGRRDQRSNRRYDRRDNRRNDRYRSNRGNNNRRAYSYTTSRITRRGMRMYRETIRVTQQPNGRTRTQVIRRVRIR